jgi:hypothetical protein
VHTAADVVGRDSVNLSQSDGPPQCRPLGSRPETSKNRSITWCIYVESADIACRLFVLHEARIMLPESGIFMGGVFVCGLQDVTCSMYLMGFGDDQVSYATIKSTIPMPFSEGRSRFLSHTKLSIGRVSPEKAIKKSTFRPLAGRH